jgi:hypothetical protein
MIREKEPAALLNLDTQGFAFDPLDVTEASFYGIPSPAIHRAEGCLLDPSVKSVAYFSMEFGLAPSVYHPYQTKRPLSPRNKKRDFEIFSNLRQMDYYHLVQSDTVVDIPIYSGGLGVLATR